MIMMIIMVVMMTMMVNMTMNAGDEDDDDTAGSRRVVQLLEKMTRDWPKETHSKSPKWATAENSSRSSPFSKSSSSSPSSILMSNSILLLLSDIYYFQIWTEEKNKLTIAKRPSADNIYHSHSSYYVGKVDLML